MLVGDQYETRMPIELIGRGEIAPLRPI